MSSESALGLFSLVTSSKFFCSLSLYKIQLDTIHRPIFGKIYGFSKTIFSKPSFQASYPPPAGQRQSCNNTPFSPSKPRFLIRLGQRYKTILEFSEQTEVQKNISIMSILESPMLGRVDKAKKISKFFLECGASHGSSLG